MDLTGFDWGWMNHPKLDSNGVEIYHFGRDCWGNDVIPIPMGKYHKDSIYKEIFIDKLYEKHFEVQEGDTVLDVGASVGPFTYSILSKNPKQIFTIEPSDSEFITLTKNLGSNSNVTLINKGITSLNGTVESDQLFGGETQMEGITFKDFIKENNIEKIDFLKTDCEGGEYDIFHIDNFCWLKENLGVAVGEWHLDTPELKQKFRVFRDVFLRLFPNHQVSSIDDIDIKWDLWNEHFIEYYNGVIIYIDNR
jgi:FkbM family methyltransferase